MKAKRTKVCGEMVQMEGHEDIFKTFITLRRGNSSVFCNVYFGYKRSEIAICTVEIKNFGVTCGVFSGLAYLNIHKDLRSVRKGWHIAFARAMNEAKKGDFWAVDWKKIETIYKEVKKLLNSKSCVVFRTDAKEYQTLDKVDSGLTDKIREV